MSGVGLFYGQIVTENDYYLSTKDTAIIRTEV